MKGELGLARAKCEIVAYSYRHRSCDRRVVMRWRWMSARESHPQQIELFLDEPFDRRDNHTTFRVRGGDIRSEIVDSNQLSTRNPPHVDVHVARK